MSTVLITGCSHGIGRAAAFAFVRAGFAVFATARRGVDCETLRADAQSTGITLQTLPLDVTDEGSIASAVTQVIDAAGAIDVLINNAGIARIAAVEDMPPEDVELTMRTNFLGPLWLTREVLPHMRARNSGRIIMVSSLSAAVGLPGVGLYSASKAALERASESLRSEVDRFNIHVSVVAPGAVNTRMPEQMGAQTDASGSPYAGLIDYLVAQTNERLGSGIDAQDVAELLVSIASDAEPRFIYAAGAQAEGVLARIADMDDRERENWIHGINDTAWWSRGSKIRSQ